MRLPCKNCNNPMEDADAKVFAEVLVCSTCFLMASRLYDHLHNDMTGCLMLAKDKIREMLTTGQFKYSTEEQRSPISKQELLTAITDMYNRKDEDRIAGSLSSAVSVRSEGGAPKSPTRSPLVPR